MLKVCPGLDPMNSLLRILLWRDRTPISTAFLLPKSLQKGPEVDESDLHDSMQRDQKKINIDKRLSTYNLRLRFPHILLIIPYFCRHS
jgi:hypothetical protein